MELRLTPRLAAVAEAVPQGARLADVGTDHAYLPTRLILEGKIPGAVATDLRPGPLERAAATVEKYAVGEKISLRLGDGLEPVRPEEVDAVAIAGMGGETILDILARAPWAAEKCCVVQPMTSVEDLRRRLPEVGLRIAGERIAREGESLYIILALEPGESAPLTAAECWVGRWQHHRDDSLWPEYLAQETRRVRRALEGLRRSAKPEDAARRQALELVVAELAQMERL